MENQNTLKFSDIQKEILIGTLLGDAHLESRTQGRTYRAKFEQPSSKKEYIEHLYKVFQPWTSSSLRSNSENICFQTITHSSLRFYGQKFYNGKHKIVPKAIDKWLTPTAFAYWYMDDGSIKSKESKVVILNTQSFTLGEVELLCNALEKNFQFAASPRKQKEGYQIYISGNSYERFLEVIAPLIHDSMRYKIPSARKT